MTSGCPYLKWDWKCDCEKCKITDNPTNGALKCEFDYDECEEYKAKKPKEPK